MAQELARHGYQISPGTLYPLLHRLEQDGLLTSESKVVAGKAAQKLCGNGQGAASAGGCAAEAGRADW